MASSFSSVLPGYKLKDPFLAVLFLHDDSEEHEKELNTTSYILSIDVVILLKLRQREHLVSKIENDIQREDQD